MPLVPDLGKVPGDLELHTLVRRDLPRTFFPDTFVKIVIGVLNARAISNSLPAETRLMPHSYL
jgi:hypothetical protein